MGYVIVIFGSLIALNWGFGYWLSEENRENRVEGVVEIEQIPAVDDDEKNSKSLQETHAKTEYHQ